MLLVLCGVSEESFPKRFEELAGADDAANEKGALFSEVEIFSDVPALAPKLKEGLAEAALPPLPNANGCVEPPLDAGGLTNDVRGWAAFTTFAPKLKVGSAAEAPVRGA